MESVATSLLSDNLTLFWLYLELGTLSLVPCFFLAVGGKSLQALFSYLIASSVSSFFIICGVMWEDFLFLVVLGLCIKFGLFPFFGWVYNVIEGSNWVVVWGFSTFLKSGFLFFPFFLSSGGLIWVELVAVISFLSLSFLFWLYSYSWLQCWCHMMLSSSVALVCMSLVLGSELLLWLFLVYICWSSLVIYFLSCEGFDSFGSFEGISYYFFVGLLVSHPLSVAIFYKLFMGLSIYSCAFFVFLGWLLYSVSEQFYLLKYFIGQGLPRGSFGTWSLV